ncbi:Single-stranded DNA-binding protein [Dyadobacter sp. CECT 9623]|jgi:single-strand DNA-binding protein|uniref:Single-stranded DNA-binding protein n=1 Tax=Dyadobacter linearis TaxID=2823330 RepID=A0ABN7R7T4_9BACT|nr:single-stranded DNA-binding protein [Dyadobacter sp. CECT 9623]CAG5070063.1 Single-stranded DNA-binding protein [Dyadobacter sp. CECT 9623]
MAGSVNKVILIGNLGSDPEVRYLESGSAVAKFNIATTESYTNKSGERVDNTEWHRIELWEGLAKVAEKYLKKGNQVYIEGRIRTDSWTDKEGQQRTGVTIRANSMTLLGGPSGSTPGGESSGGYQQQNQQPRAAQAPRSSDPIPPSLASGSNDDDDLPF